MIALVQGKKLCLIIYKLGLFSNKSAQVIIYPEYDRVYNDLALIRLSEPIDFEGMELRPICLPSTQSFNDSVEKGVVAGLQPRVNPTKLFSC